MTILILVLLLCPPAVSLSLALSAVFGLLYARDLVIDKRLKAEALGVLNCADVELQALEAEARRVKEWNAPWVKGCPAPAPPRRVRKC